MRVNIVVAIDQSGAIGHQGALPWRLSADLRRFREITTGHPIIMGRRTHESIGRPLPGRLNIVLSRDPTYQARGCVVRPGLAAALEMCAELDEVMVVGGSEVYTEALPLAGRLFVTEVDASSQGDVAFPSFARENWIETSRVMRPADDSNEFSCSFVVLEKLPAS
jgi:dihydrofolate reductase